jgi:7-carboxy-7-deazaguanine synthase
MIVAKMPKGTPEIYPAIQGEGPTMSQLCVFVRLSMCNLSCNFCDTSYTWYFKGLTENKEHKYSLPCDKKKFALEMSVEDVEIAIRKAAGPIRRVIFTGGEPMLQQKAIREVMDLLRRDGENWIFEIETNGTICLMPELVGMFTNINCSPKLASSGNEEILRNKTKVIQQFLSETATTQVSFKFVIGQKTHLEDFKEIRRWMKEHLVPKNLIYLMPEGITPKQIKDGTIFLFNNYRQYGFNITTRLQVLVYGKKRAV